MLAVRGLSVRYGGHLAVIDADLDAPGGEITGLIGPNGAGKTTMFNAICGLQPMSAGRIDLDGVEITSLPTHKRAKLGLARTFQKLELFGSLTARENLQVAAESRGRVAGDGDGTAAEQALVAVDDSLHFVGLAPFADVRADELSTGHARLLELGRALVTRPKVLLLDEPASGLDAAESEQFAGIIRALADDAGMAILLVEHDVPLVMATCSTVYVLDFGAIIACDTPDAIQRNPRVRAAYLGTEEGAA